MKHKGLYQLLCAATVDSRFCESLLRNPAQAIATGYLGQPFPLTVEEQEFVLGIQVHELEDLGAQIQHWLSSNGNGNGNGHNTSARMEDLAELFHNL